MTARDHMISSPGMRGRAARKNRIRISQEPNSAQLIVKISFTMSHDPSNVSITK